MSWQHIKNKTKQSTCFNRLSNPQASAEVWTGQLPDCQCQEVFWNLSRWSVYTLSTYRSKLSVLRHRLYSTVMDPCHILTTLHVSTNSRKVSFVHICSSMCCICFIHDYSSQWSNMECQCCVNFISCGFIHMFVIIL